MFVCVAFVFWLFLSLDSEVQKDFEIPTEIIDIPANVTVIGKAPNKFDITVQGKGSQLLRFLWGTKPTIKIKFEDNVSETDIFSLSKVKIESRFRDYFGQGIQIISVKPDSIRLPFTTMPGESVALRLIADVQPDLQCILSGPIKANIDSVKVYGVNGVPRSIKYVDTNPITLSELKDTTRLEISIKPIDGYRIIPDKVTVTIPVEPLIAKRRQIAVDVVGLPEGLDLITFPSSVEVTYLVPMSKFNEDYPIKTFVDYSQIDSLRPTAPVTVSSVPEYYKNLALSPDSIEYIIERRHSTK